MRRLLVTTLLAFVAVCAPAAAAPPPARLDVAARLLDQPAGHPWAIDLGVTATIGDEPGAKRVPLRRMALRFPHAHVDDGAFPSCSQDILDHQGWPGCPDRAIVGHGTVLVDARPLVDDPVHATLTVYNGPRRGRGRVLVFGVRVREVVNMDLTIPGVLRPVGGRYGYALDVPIPLVRTIPGAPAISIARLDVTVGARRGGHSFLEAPRRCPARGLPFAAEFGFQGGGRRSARAVISCTLRASSEG